MEILNRHHFKDRPLPDGAIYVGRGHPLGNPYRIGPDGTREEVIEKYRRYLESNLDDPRIADAMRYLRPDSKLVCSCAPAPCHAEIIRDVWMRHFRHLPPLIFVFGSNLAGRHGKGAAEYARRVCGAKYGVGYGPQGSAYAIPTKDRHLETLPVSEIAVYARDFLEYARSHSDAEFRVSGIGCGQAGYIAPMFAAAPSNCAFEDDWLPVMKPHRALAGFSRRLLVGGSRAFPALATVADKLARLTSNWSPKSFAVIAGGAEGVDMEAGAFARAHGATLFEFKPSLCNAHRFHTIPG